MKNRNCLSGDPLAKFESRVRNAGVWCDTKVNDKLRHYFIAKNAGSMLAISLCGQAIQRIEGLHENVVSQKCLVCELFKQGRREVDNHFITTLNTIVDNIKQSKTQDKEK